MNNRKQTERENSLNARFVWFRNVLLLTIFSSCLQPVDVLTEGNGGIVVISGQLSNLNDQSIVTVGITAETERLPFPVSGAVVNLFRGDEFVGAFTEDEFIPGKYKLEYSGIPGQSYHVQVVLPDNRIYESAQEEMASEAGSITPYVEFVSEEAINDGGNLVTRNFVKVYTNSFLPSGQGNYLRWSVEEVYIILETPDPFAPTTPPPCFVTQNADPQNIVLLDMQYLNASEFPDQFLAKRLVDESFMLRHYFVTYQSVLTREAFDYWRKVEILINQSGSIFDVPPAKIFGNISCITNANEKVYGYFQVNQQAVGRVLLQKEDFPFILNYNDCVGSGPQTFPPPTRCLNCLSVRNSSHVKPPWF